MKTYLILILFLITSPLIAQIQSVDYQMKYNCETNQYDVKIIILKGSATTIPQRAQFNSQISIVVPTGEQVEITEKYMPLENNQNYNGTTPLKWTLGTGKISPEAQPESDFYGISPTLSPASFYNDLEEGDKVTLFSFTAGTIGTYDENVRFFQNGVDPGISDLGGDFSNGFTMGGSAQLYNSNSSISCITDTHNEILQEPHVYPNPFQNHFVIESKTNINKIIIIGPDGQICYQADSKPKRLLTINTFSYPKGLYYLRIETERLVYHKKLIKL